MCGAALFLSSHLLSPSSFKDSRVKVSTGYPSQSQLKDNPRHPSFGSKRKVSDKSSLPSVEEEGKNEMNRGVSEEGERREVEE